MAKRNIIKIDEEKCNGCSLCIPNCPEGAIQIIDNKARLINDLFCDGLGACIGHCPQGAITIEEREAEPYEERKVMKNIVKQGKNTILAHLNHLKEHNEEEYLNQALNYLKENKININFDHSKNKKTFCACPGSEMKDFSSKKSNNANIKLESELRQWPIQFHLVPINALFFNNADLLITADCVPFAYANFHNDFLKNKPIIIGCPKLDDTEAYEEKLTEIIKQNSLKSISILHMQVPCCFGLQRLAETAIKKSKKNIPLKEIVISIQGEKISN